VNELKGVSEVQIIDGCIKVEAHKVSRSKAAHALEKFPFCNILSERNLEVGLNSLKQISSVDISELIIPNLGVILIDGRCVDISPQSEGRLSVSEDHVKEGDDSIPFSVLLTLLIVVLIVVLENAVLNVHPKDILQASGSNFSLEDPFKPR
jgi:hypothetical protein